MAKKSKTQKESGVLVAAVNRKARSDYEILTTHEAGLVLLGSEVKSIRAGGVNLKEAYVRPINGELFLVGCHISPYARSPVDAHLPLRDRKLLLHSREIERLAVETSKKGLTLVPLQLYFKDGRCKLEIGVGRGKKHFDKREDIKAREADRAIQRAMKGRQRDD